jgi:hypothetical protein
MASGGVRKRKVFVNKNRICDCGQCVTCKHRPFSRQYYQRHKEDARRRYLAFLERKRALDRVEPDDAILDMEALEWLIERGLR